MNISDSPKAVHYRRLMIETQLKPRGITDAKVLTAIARIPRHRFAPFNSLREAYADSAAPIDSKQTISQPYMVAYMTQALALEPQHKVLEIGTGSGYQTAVLAELVTNLYTIERHPNLSLAAQQLLNDLGYHNIHHYIADGTLGLSHEAPFDRILIAAAAKTLPESLINQLAQPSGIMIFPLEHANGMQELLKLTWNSSGKPETESLGPVRFVPLVSQPEDEAPSGG